MTAIALQFLAGRFHATPWGRHANEGVVEWPPSPWRLLRALVATWLQRLPGVPAAEMQALLAALAAPPHVHLPAGTPAHSRHFMPWFKKGPADRTQVFDAFVAVDPRAELVLAWPGVELSPEQTALLAALLDRLPYLGRAESWCQGRLCSPPPSFNCWPLAPGERVPEGHQPVRLLAAAPLAGADLIQALLVDTEELRSGQKRLDPPGSRWVTYARPAGALVPHPRPGSVARDPGPVHAVRYLLDGKPLPLLTEAVAVGEWARQAAQSQYGKLTGGGSSPVLSGRMGREPMRGHGHAFYLPSDADGDGRLDHLTVYAPMGLGPVEVEALARLRRLWTGADRPELRLALLGFYTRDELAQADAWSRPATTWVSITPYVLTRHPKLTRDGRPRLDDRGEQLDGPEDQVRREWALRAGSDSSLPPLLAVERIGAADLPAAGRSLRWLEFRRWRSRGGGRTAGIACGLRLTFASPVAGPLALGYGCHYGLGQFRPVG